jgi:hypothetical protein
MCGVDKFNEATLSQRHSLRGAQIHFADVAYKICFQRTTIETGLKLNYFPIVGDGNAIRATGAQTSVKRRTKTRKRFRALAMKRFRVFRAPY